MFVELGKNELTRVKREHFENKERCDKIQEQVGLVQKQIVDICEKQGLNDTGMATLFKINQISAALELQDEEDKQKMFLMGASDVGSARSNTQGSVRASA